MMSTVLFVDDEPKVLAGLSRALHAEAYDIVTANSAEEAAGILAAHSVDVIVTDEEMPGMSGTEFLGRVAQAYPDIVGIVLTGHPTLPAALRAINEGRVHQFFTKPCNEVDLAITIRRAIEQKELRAKSRELLDVSRRQSILLEEARLLRRMQGAHEPDTSPALATAEEDIEDVGLLAEMDRQIRRGVDILAEVGNDGAESPS